MNNRNNRSIRLVILIIQKQQIYKARNDVIDVPYKEFSVIKLNQMKKVND